MPMTEAQPILDRLAAPGLLAGKGVDAALALPVYLRDKVAFTAQELQSR